MRSWPTLLLYSRKRTERIADGPVPRALRSCHVSCPDILLFPGGQGICPVQCDRAISRIPVSASTTLASF
jgi:hypothetical protein